MPAYTKQLIKERSAIGSFLLHQEHPVIVSLDIETTPLAAYTWGPKWETSLIEVTGYSNILSYSVKLLGGKQITRGWINLPGYKPGKIDDKKIVKELWEILNSSDVVITQNGKDFDIRVINSRFSFHGLTPPSPYKVIDTKIEARKYLRLPSHSLDDLSAYFGLGKKLRHQGFDLWKLCMAGDKDAWGTMLRYNRHDVVLLEKLYLKLLPWMGSHPNLGMYHTNLVCPYCGSSHVNYRGFNISRTTKYRRIQCRDCGGWSRDHENLMKGQEKPIVPAT